MACFAIYGENGLVTRAGECPDRDALNQAMPGESVALIARDDVQAFVSGCPIKIVNGKAHVMPRAAISDEMPA